MDRDAPPWIALTGYFAGDAKAGRGRPRTSIATCITSDLQRRNIDLKRSNQLENVRAIALDKPTSKYMEKSGRQSMIWRHRSSVHHINNYLDNGI